VPFDDYQVIFRYPAPLTIYKKHDQIYIYQKLSGMLMTMLDIKVYNCALCGTEFESDVITSTNTFGGKDSEFRVYAFGLQPLRFILAMCPKCGYTSYSHKEHLTFNEMQAIEALLKSEITKSIDEKMQYSAFKFYIYARILEVRKASIMKIARAYLNAAWIADDDQEYEKAVKYRKLAISTFVSGLKANNIPEEDIPIITYLVGEIYRRIGEFDSAIEWFMKVKTRDERLIKLCSHQIELARKNDKSKVFLKKIFEES